MVLRGNFYTGPSKFYPGQARVGQGVATPLPHGEPMEHSNCSDDDTTLSVAVQKLETVAHQSGFILYCRYGAA